MPKLLKAGNPFAANPVMHAMNGVILGSKQFTMRLYEPKRLRQEQLAKRFRQSGVMSSTLSEEDVWQF